jgi:hypothetical protein
VKSSLPTILVATKCDNPESARQIDTEGLAAACKSCIGSFKTASSKPESARMPLSFLLKALILGRQGKWVFFPSISSLLQAVAALFVIYLHSARPCPGFEQACCGARACKSNSL